MNAPEKTNLVAPVLVELVNELLIFEGQAIDNPAELAALTRSPKVAPVLVEVVGQILDFDESVIQDPKDLADLKRRRVGQPANDAQG